MVFYKKLDLLSVPLTQTVNQDLTPPIKKQKQKKSFNISPSLILSSSKLINRVRERKWKT